MKTDILAFGAHPDDVEMGCGGTLAKSSASGKTVGIIDLTRGELGTNGTPELRDKEANSASKIIGANGIQKSLFLIVPRINFISSSLRSYISN